MNRSEFKLNKFLLNYLTIENQTETSNVTKCVGLCGQTNLATSTRRDITMGR